MKVYDVRWDDSENYWVLATFSDREHAQRVLDRINPLLFDTDYEALTIHEQAVLEQPVKFKDIDDVLDWLDGEVIMLEDTVSEMRLHLEAIRSAPEDYTPEQLALWGVNHPKSIRWGEDAPNEELKLQEDKPLW